jgi:predicted ATPase
VKLIQFEYCDKVLDWKLQSTSFNGLNLLVGISGVGKTKILQAIMNIKGTALGAPISGLNWRIKFQTDEDSIYEWNGETEKIQIKSSFTNKIFKRGQITLNATERPSKILNETLVLNGNEIFRRSETEIIYKKQTIPQLSESQSIINIINDDVIKPIKNGFSKILFRDISKNLIEIQNSIPKSVNSKDKIYKNLNVIKNSGINYILKLLLASKNKHQVFTKIKNKFKEIFPQVTDLVIKEEPAGNGINFVFVYIKEKGIEELIHQDNISSGMMRTIEHLSDIYLSPDDAVILIDEFETSLGVNCINFITDGILENKNKNQYIITSHHPYIINNVSKDFWKLVTRKGNTVSTHSAKELNLPESNHEAFLQLLNLETYTEGIFSA